MEFGISLQKKSVIVKCSKRIILVEFLVLLDKSKVDEHFRWDETQSFECYMEHKSKSMHCHQ